MKFKYIYLFTIGNKIVHSCETAESLKNRVKGTGSTEEDRDEVNLLIEMNHVGSHCSLSTGEHVVQIA